MLAGYRLTRAFERVTYLRLSWLSSILLVLSASKGKQQAVWALVTDVLDL